MFTGAGPGDAGSITGPEPYLTGPGTSSSFFYQSPYHTPMSPVASELAQLRAMMMCTLQGMEKLKEDVYSKKKSRKHRSRSHSLLSASSDSEFDTPGDPEPRSRSHSIPAGSVLLGNPRSDQQIIIPGCSHTTVRALEASSTTPDELALGLADILFTKDELSSSLVTQKEGRNLLDPDRVEGIRLHVNYKFPENVDNEVLRWKKLKKKLNNKCRNTRNRLSQ